MTESCRRPSRRTILHAAAAGLGAVSGVASLTPRAGAQIRGTQDGGIIQPRPIAIPDFISQNPQLGREVAGVVAADLERSGLFKLLNPAGFPQRFNSINDAYRGKDWAAAGAEALVIGQVAQGSDGRVQAEYRLHDPVLQKPLDGKRFAHSQWRKVAHLAADAIYERLTGDKGYFDTQIVYVDETGPKDKRTKRLAIMDQDGANVRTLSQGREIVLTPRFNPVRQEICFMTYVGERPRVVIMNLATGQREVVGNLPGDTFGARFSPDGNRLVMSFQQAGDAQLIEMDLRARQSRQLTQLQAKTIDTGPCYSPDARNIVFESDREGTQQLYVMGFDGSGVRRLSRGDGRYSTPVWSPRNDWIAFTKQAGGAFMIGVMRPDGSGERILSEGFHNEGPTWAPNGRVVMFFSETRGPQGGPRLHTVDVTGYNPRQVPTPSFASDPAWSPLLG
jgi:TolB protein